MKLISLIDAKCATDLVLIFLPIQLVNGALSMIKSFAQARKMITNADQTIKGSKHK